MKLSLLKSVFLLAFFGIFSGCVNHDSFEIPKSTLQTYEFTPTTTVEAIQQMATDTPVVFANEDIVEAFVTSSDEKGNFYKSISLQTIPADGSDPVGFSIPINVNTLYGKGFKPGRKVYIQLKGLYFAMVYGSLQIGSLDENTIGRISEWEWKRHLFPSAVIIPEDAFVRTVSLAEAYKDSNQNTLIELDAVQFADTSLNRTYYDVDSGGGATNHTLVSSAGGLGQIIRFSSFCPFSGKPVPDLSGKIRGVLTKYATDFQFIVRYESDIMLAQPRFDSTPPKGGTDWTYLGTLTETFTSYAANASVFPKYGNDAVAGTRYWQVKTFGTNKYIQMSSFGGTPEVNKTLFIVPVDFTAANTFSFKTLSGYDNGSPLKVYYTTDYVLGGNWAAATVTDITYHFNIPNGPASGYASAFTHSGIYTLPAGLTGNGFFVFEYNGNGNDGITTTMEIDDIVIN